MNPPIFLRLFQKNAEYFQFKFEKSIFFSIVDPMLTQFYLDFTSDLFAVVPVVLVVQVLAVIFEVEVFVIAVGVLVVVVEVLVVVRSFINKLEMCSSCKKEKYTLLRNEHCKRGSNMSKRTQFFPTHAFFYLDPMFDPV